MSLRKEGAAGGNHMAGKQLQPTKAVNPDAWLHLFGLGLDYYIAGRAAAMAGLAPVAGNLLHHAVEMLVKADLSKTIPLVELKARRFGHGLPALVDGVQAESSRREPFGVRFVDR